VSVRPRRLLDVSRALRPRREAAASNATHTVRVSGGDRTVPIPIYRSGLAGHWIYFLLLDRFNDPDEEPAGTGTSALTSAKAALSPVGE
jgi:hypothetical protein